MYAKIVQVRKRGTITLPITLREKYRLEEGDPITLVDLGEGVFLSPKHSLIPKLAKEIERKMFPYWHRHWRQKRVFSLPLTSRIIGLTTPLD